MNLYVHFPFCRTRCSYCSLYSRAGRPESERNAYAHRVADAIASLRAAPSGTDPSALGTDPSVLGTDPSALGTDPSAPGTVPLSFKTIYFGGGSPALCDLKPVFDSLNWGQTPSGWGQSPSGWGQTPEFTVELHPLDVSQELLETLKAGGVNRISMGIQSLDDDILADMGRGYTFAEAERAFAAVKAVFDNAGIDLIVGYPGEKMAILPQHKRLADWGLRHCSVYSLQNERHLANVVDDDTVLDRISETAEFLRGIGLVRYEISNYAVPGYECQHNMSVWRGEDYIGIGDGACGRIGLRRTRNFWGLSPSHPPPKRGLSPSAGGLSPPKRGLSPCEEWVDEEFDEKERRLFRLRTTEGLDATGHSEWGQALGRFVSEGLLTRDGNIYRLTARGTEVCDFILSELA